MAESIEEPIVAWKSLGVLDELVENNESDYVVVRNTITGRFEYVSKASLGGGTQDLQSVLTQGNQALNTPIILNGALYSNRVYDNGFRSTYLSSGNYTNLNFAEPTLNGNIQFPAPLDEEVHTLPIQFNIDGSIVEANDNGVVEINTSGTTDMLTKTVGGNTATLEFNDILVNGARFLLPSVTTVQDFPLVIAVNQKQPNDGGVVDLTIQDVIEQGGGTYDGLEGVYFTVSNDFTEPARMLLETDGLVSFSGDAISFNSKNNITFGALLGSPNFRLRYNTIPTLTLDDELVHKKYVDDAIAGVGGGGTVTAVTGTAGVTVANGTTTPLIGLGNITPTSVNASGTVTGSNLLGTNTGDNATNTTSNTYADGKVADNLTASTTVAPSKTAVNTALGLKQNVISGTGVPVFTGTTINWQTQNDLVRNAQIGGDVSSGVTPSSTTTFRVMVWELYRAINLLTPYTASATLDFPSTAAGMSSDLTITVTGAAVGKPVRLGVPDGSVLTSSCYTAWVSAANTVTIRLNNYASTTKDPAGGVFTVQVAK